MTGVNPAYDSYHVVSVLEGSDTGWKEVKDRGLWDKENLDLCLSGAGGAVGSCGEEVVEPNQEELVWIGPHRESLRSAVR
jgi:hypothetical protein